jgi:ribosomal protein S18 acetylase RimI-like enzyme
MTELEILKVTSGKEAGEAWREAGRPLMNQFAWEAAVDAGAQEALIARKLGRAAGFVLVRVAGPKREDVQEVVRRHLPGEPLPPEIQWLFVRKDYRSQGIGRALMLNMEQNIATNPELPNSSVLTVEEDNNHARALYKSLGYKTLASGGEDVAVMYPEPLWDSELQEWQDIEITPVTPHLVMVKDFEKLAHL